MKLRRFLVTIFSIIVVIVFVFIIHRHTSLNRVYLHGIDHPPIAFSENDNLFIYKDFFAISGQSLNFYNNRGQQIDMPFDFVDEFNQSFTITDMTSNYILINSRFIYKVHDSKLHHIYSLDSTAVKIMEYGEYLLILVDIPDEGLRVQVLDIKNENLTNLGFDDNFYYLDSDSSSDDSNLSILALDVNGTFPSSKVLHYDENLSLFGVNTTIDKFYYRVFRLPSFSILVGNRELVCYNVEGDFEWSIENNGMNNFQIVQNNSEILIYLDRNLAKSLDEDYYNGVYIDKDGQRHNIKFPSGLTNISLYKDDKFFGLQHGNKLLIFDKKGNIVLEFYIEEDVKSIFWNQYDPNNFFIITIDGKLQIYSIEREDIL